MVNGHISTSSALLIDRSAEPVESSLPLWQTLAPPRAHQTHNALVSRKHCRCKAPVQKGLVVILPRRRTMPTHLELHVEVHSRFCHFFVDSSRLENFSGVLLLNLMLCLLLLDLVEFAALLGFDWPDPSTVAHKISHLALDRSQSC